MIAIVCNNDEAILMDSYSIGVKLSLSIPTCAG